MTAGVPAEPAAGGRLGLVLGLLRADAPGTVTGAPQDWPRWAVLLPHVLAAADHFTALPPGGQQDTAGDDAAWLLDRAAAYLQVRARLAQVRPLAERALAIDEAAHGPGRPHVAALLSHLALIQRDLGDPAGARPLAERALAITEAALGPDHPVAGTLRANLAVIVADLGQSGLAAGDVPGVVRRRGRLEGDAGGGT